MPTYFKKISQVTGFKLFSYDVRHICKQVISDSETSELSMIAARIWPTLPSKKRHEYRTRAHKIRLEIMEKGPNRIANYYRDDLCHMEDFECYFQKRKNDLKKQSTV